MLVRWATEDELVSKKVMSLHHLEVVWFCIPWRGAPINVTDPFAAASRHVANRSVGGIL
ncbi:hypothetical protein LDENG_00184750 [Lucifuga dentata]|nr:hypothetical protein LDENG_00184750 [Lucifuga dentata]